MHPGPALEGSRLLHNRGWDVGASRYGDSALFEGEGQPREDRWDVAGVLRGGTRGGMCSGLSSFREESGMIEGVYCAIYLTGSHPPFANKRDLLEIFSI